MCAASQPAQNRILSLFSLLYHSRKQQGKSHKSVLIHGLLWFSHGRELLCPLRQITGIGCCTEFVWPGFGSGQEGGTRVASVRSC